MVNQTPDQFGSSWFLDASFRRNSGYSSSPFLGDGLTPKFKELFCGELSDLSAIQCFPPLSLPSLVLC